MYLIRDILWSYLLPLAVLYVGCSLFFVLGFRPYRWMLAALKSMSRRATHYGISPFQTLTTVLSGTVGTGTIAGVATAVSVGGPGALFYMWIVALFGMLIKYAEAMLAIRYRHVDAEGRYYGGAMYYIAHGKPNISTVLALCYAVACIASSCGIGASVQAHSIASGLFTHFDVSPMLSAAALAVIAGLVALGGVERIAKISSYVVPLMIVLYLGMCTWVLWQVRSKLLFLLYTIVHSAVYGYQESSLWYGTCLGVMIQQGVSRGVFTNEAGLGSSSFAQAASMSHQPEEQSAISMVSTFIDTMIVCTMTGLVILSFDIDGRSQGTAITIAAMAHHIPYAEYLITACLILFGLSTMFSWNYYGYEAWRYMHTSSAPYFHLLWLLAIIYGCFDRGTAVWMYADLANAGMMLPNLWALYTARHTLTSRAQQHV